VSMGHAQVQLNNAYRVWQFKGSTVGEKTVKAQEACSPDTDIPCLIVFDPVLAIFPAGTMPVKCEQCFWIDYRNPSALFGSGAGGVGTSSNTQVLFNDGGALGGDAGITYNKDTNTLSVGAVETTGAGYNNLPSQADSTTLGDYWRNGDVLSYRASTGTKTLATVDQIGGGGSSIICKQTSVQAGDTITSNTDFATACPIGANSLAVGDVVVVEAHGVASSTTGSNSTIDFMVNYAGVDLFNVADSACVAQLATAQTNRPWHIRAVFTILAIGASGSAELAVEGACPVAAGSASQYHVAMAAPVTINTTAATSISFGVTSGAAAALPLTMRQLIGRKN
jgi:hypothetical protein